MRLSHGLHLAYCTNIHRGESWPEIFAALQRDTLAVRKQVCPDHPYAIGLRLGEQAARQLGQKEALASFRQWLESTRCYVFTINGFPYGRFHGTRVKEQVYSPDWTTRERLEYTNLLFDLLAELLPEAVEGSVSTVPCSFKEFIKSADQVQAMQQNLWRCVEHIAALSARTGKDLHLGLEPEPLCFLETSAETVDFLDEMRTQHPGDGRWSRHLGVNYDTCHLAVEYESPPDAFARFREHGIRISKIHLSSALRVQPTSEARKALTAFADDTYFHQVIERKADGSLRRYRDLDLALRQAESTDDRQSVEWRIHFHIPLHSPATPLFENTTDHLLGVLDLLQADPRLCTHLEMETYTWEVMPPELKNRSVISQLVSEYGWCLGELEKRGIRAV